MLKFRLCHRPRSPLKERGKCLEALQGLESLERINGSEGFGGPWRLLEALGSPSIVLFKILEKSGNLGCQQEARKGIKSAGCLRKQVVGRINQRANCWFVGHERCALARYAVPPHPSVCRGAISTCYLQPPRSKTP